MVGRERGGLPIDGTCERPTDQQIRIDPDLQPCLGATRARLARQCKGFALELRGVPVDGVEPACAKWAAMSWIGAKQPNDVYSALHNGT